VANFGSEKINDGALLAARILLVALYVISGFTKVTHYSQTVSYMEQVGAPMPMLAAAVAIFMEIPVAVAVILGAFTRQLARR
jgi:putative oxidoreductase